MLRGSSSRARLAGRHAPNSGGKLAPPLLGSAALWLPPLLQVSFATEAGVTGGKQQGQAEGAGDVLTQSPPGTPRARAPTPFTPRSGGGRAAER
jgi:hypothetical protein